MFIENIYQGVTMNLLIISASQRTESQSAKVAKYIESSEQHFSTTTHIELCKLAIPLWDGEQQSKHTKKSDWGLLETDLSNADAIILITPEWSGTASPLLKNVLLMCESQHCAHKPTLLISVSGGISGAYPIGELRMNAFKNNKMVAIPDHLIIRDVSDYLNEIEQEVDTMTAREQQLRQRIAYSLHTLIHYAKSFKTLRLALNSSPFPHEENYAYGM